MGGYIGAKSGVGLVNTTLGSVQDLTATDASPEVTLINSTHEDTDGGREGKVIFKGQQSGGEESTLAEIQASHDGTADDEKGDLIFKTNDGSDGASPTERVRIDSEGNLGLGSSSPTTYVDGSAGSTLVLESSGTDRGALVFASECTGGANEILGLINFTDTANTTTNKRSAAIRGVRGSSDANAYLTFTTDNTERMRIDSDGNITKPSQTSFHVQMNTNQTGYNASTSSGTQDYIQYDTEVYDTGNNISSGLFTAPVDGIYLFRAEAYCNVGIGQSWFLVNGGRPSGTDLVYTSGTSFAHNSAILKLSANDTVAFRPYAGSQTNVTIYQTDKHTWFRGILIG